ncbi:hypothetical protein EV189_2254 [Motilibacter rhizosphaerae]|uniref:DUF6603 domain-containing protein n=1 Tax=Motilibacter rhizosphaerae TaxID=598652 RepID=A0A4Q7NP94_9ACTN|nr:DUF6603 domain-containing protein [Motilibacter rhizosphaerae]RZS86838.1 hypothetical protein EV189_2254 [Motilibacter rhizosphaerae]
MTDLGELTGLATALGLLDAGGGFRGDWFADPGRYLSQVLRDPGQRAALLAFARTLLPPGTTPPPDGWVPLVAPPGTPLELGVVVVPGAAQVELGLGVRLDLRTGSGVAVHASAHLPLFAQPLAPGDLVVLPGRPGSALLVTLGLGLPPDPDAAVSLAGLDVTATVPTDGTSAPDLAVVLRGLRLPGSVPRDLRLDAAALPELEHALAPVLLALVRAEVAAPGTPPDLAGLAALLGLADDAVPDLPVEDLLRPGALLGWLRGALAPGPARDAWLAGLAGLLGGSATADGVEVVVAGATLTLAPELAGSVLVVRTGLHVAGADGVRLALDAVPVRLDLASGAATALPELALSAVLSGAGGTPLLAPEVGPAGLEVGVGSLALGFALDPARRPLLVVQARDADVGASHFPVLDLTSPDALAAAAQQAVSDAAGSLLAGLGGAAGVLGVVLGLRDLPDGTVLPRVDPAHLLADPLAALAAYWQALLAESAATVGAVLSLARDGVSSAAGALAGTGTADDPWLLGLAAGLDLTVARPTGRLELGLRATAAQPGTGDLLLTARLADLDLGDGGAPRRATFLASGSAAVRLGGGPADPLALGGDALSLRASRVGLAVGWTGASVAVQPVAEDVVLLLDGAPLAVPLPVVGPDGTLALDESAWDALQLLLAAGGAAYPDSPLPDLVALLGWTGELPALALADLTADPAGALRAWLGALLDVEAPRVVDALAQQLAALLAPSGMRLGTGTPGRPWLLPLSASADPLSLALELLPGLLLCAGPGGPDPSAATLLGPPLARWRPGDPGLDPVVLADALATESALDEELAALLAGRADVADGLRELLDRWTSTDGLVALPAGTPLPAGCTAVPVADLVHTAPLDSLDLAAVLGVAPPATVAYVAMDGSPVLPGVPDGRRLALTGAGPATAYVLPGPAGDGSWAFTLGPRQEAGGVDGQATRLAAVLAPLVAAGPVVVVAHGGAGHAAVRAAATAGATAVVTVGTPWSPLTVDTLDRLPGGDALRLLATLLQQLDAAEAADAPGADDDEDLARGRALLGLWSALDLTGDPLGELVAPSPPAASPVPVSVVVGALSGPTVLRAVTAVVAATLSARAAARAASAPDDDPSDGSAEDPPTATSGVQALCWGLRLPLLRPVPRAGLLVTAGVDLDLPVPGAAGHPPRIVVRVAVGAVDGWLVGGPDPGRTPGQARPLALRRVTAEVRLPLGAGQAEARLDLHDLRAFGTTRPRWTVGGPGAEALLPEVRAVLGELAARLEAAAGLDAGLASVVATLRALGVLAPGGGVDAVTLERLLLDPGAVAAEIRTARAAELVAALQPLLGAGAGGSVLAVDLAAAGDASTLSATLDLATGRVGVVGSGSVPVPWALTLDAAGSGVTGSLRLGPDPASAAIDTAAPYVAALTISGAPLTATLTLVRPGGTTPVPLWPTADAGALGHALAELVPAGLLHVLLDAARSALRDEGAATADSLDALLGAVGLLAAPVGDQPARLRLPAGLVADPVRWLGALGPGVAVRLLDAVRALLGAAGDAGRLELAPGVSAVAAVDAGHASLALRLDPGALGGATLRLGGSAGVVLGPGVAASLSLACATDAGEVRLAVAPAGVRLAVVPPGGTEIVLLPAGPGLGGVVADAALGAAVKALPALLDAVAAHDPAGDPATAAELAGRAVAALGDALVLRAGVPLRFQAPALSAFAADPAAALLARASVLGAEGLARLRDAASPLLGPAATRAVTVADGGLRITAGPLTAGWAPATGRISVALAADGVPGVARVTASAAATSTGLEALSVELGPASFDTGTLLLRPYARAGAGSAAGLEVGLAVGDGSTRVAARLAPGAPGLLVQVAGVPVTDAGEVARAALEAVVDLLGAYVVGAAPVRTALDAPLLGKTGRQLLTGVVLDAAAPARLDPDLLDPSRLLGRVGALLQGLSGAGLDAGPLHVAVADTGGVLGLALTTTGPVELVSGEVTVTLDALTDWIEEPKPAAGLTLDLLSVTGAGVHLQPGLTVGGLGLRLGRASGPLLDLGIRLDGVALHAYAEVGEGAPSGGVRVELTGLGVALAGASGGDNPVARGLLTGGGGSDDTPRPRFSPALAVQRRAGGPLDVSFSAGDPPGPWWVVVQRGFGPLYLDKVGLAVQQADGRVQTVGVLLDGRASVLGLTAQVDDLGLTWSIASGSPFDPAHWRVDLAGLAVTADLGGVALAGALRRFPSAAGGVEYLGMLVARLGVYGLSVYGGYGVVGPPGDTFASLFLFGAVNGPIGGPPAFFVTGIGGGFGMNRGLRYPSDLSQFGDYPLIKALDPAARPGDPHAELEAARAYFPAERGTFWFAAGLSFTSFALVDGVAVLAVQIGDGVEVALLGLARMALPRPEVALVSVELGLVARFSTKEGVLLVQAQLTENSWLLFPGLKLTGGFAFAAWFGGPNRGQFVLTLGGYHPDFSRRGYPVVPRLGVAFRLGDWLVMSGGSYFALTSEAIMAGVRNEVHASLGPAWADLAYGADGIVFYDPFWFEVTVYASISAGVTIDLWIGEIDISVHLSARLTVSGPPVHVKAEFSVGPVELTVEFGDDPHHTTAISWEQFVPKYLEEASPGVAHALTAVPGKGVAAPGGSGTTGGAPTPDGSDAKPFRVTPEFDLTVTSTVPVREVDAGQGVVPLPTVPEVAVAPMGAQGRPRVTLSFVGPDGPAAVDRVARLVADPQRLGAFAIGTWGPAQQQDDAKVPSGDVLPAVDRVRVVAAATIGSSTTPLAPIPFHQVETGSRRPLPFVQEGSASSLARLAEGAARLAALVPAVQGTALDTAAVLLADRGGASAATVRAWAGERASDPILGFLGEGLGGAARSAAVTPAAPTPPEPVRLRPPVLRAVLASAGAPAERAHAASTTVADELLARVVQRTGGRLVAGAPPVLAAVDAALDPAVPARLLRPGAPAGPSGDTVLPGREVPLTRSGRTGVESVAGRGGSAADRDRLAALGAGLLQGELPVTALTVLALPDAARDVDEQRRPVLVVRSGTVRVLALLPGGRAGLDAVVGEGAGLPVPAGTRAVVLVPAVEGAPVAGWDAATALPYAGDGVHVAAGCTVRASGRVPRRRTAPTRLGWSAPDLVVGGASGVTTTFAAPVTLVAVALEGGAGDDLRLGLDGAVRPVRADGSPEPPSVVADGPRGVAVFRVVPQQVGPVAVTVVTGPTRGLAGVLGLTGDDPAAVARDIAARGFPASVPPPVPPLPHPPVVGWKEA